MILLLETLTIGVIQILLTAAMMMILLVLQAEKCTMKEVQSEAARATILFTLVQTKQEYMATKATIRFIVLIIQLQFMAETATIIFLFQLMLQTVQFNTRATAKTLYKDSAKLIFCKLQAALFQKSASAATMFLFIPALII